jgi:hypothetical protein
MDMDTWKHENTDIRHGNTEKCIHGDIETGHRDMDIETLNGDYEMETWTWRHGHGDMHMETCK